jgi:hypothetical protein
MAVVVAMAAVMTMVSETAAKTMTTAAAMTRTMATMVAVEAVAAAAVVMGVAMAQQHTWQPAVGEQCNYHVNEVPNKTNNIDAPAMAMLGQER